LSATALLFQGFGFTKTKLAGFSRLTKYFDPFADSLTVTRRDA
jgi:hypothetical protein